MGTYAYGAIGYGFILTEEAAEKYDSESNFPFDNMDAIIHDHNNGTTIVVVKDSLIEVYGDQKPEIFNLDLLERDFYNFQEEWDNLLVKIAKHYGMKIRGGHWYVGCNYG